MDEAERRIRALEAELEALREDSALAHLFRTLLEQAPDQIYFKDLESRFLAASRTVARNFGLEDPDRLVGRSDFDFFSPEHARRTFEDEQAVLRTGEPRVDLEESLCWPDGSVTWVSTTKAPFRDPGGGLAGTFGISRDITARKRAEEALRRSEENYRGLLDRLLEGFAFVDTEECFVFANPAAVRIFGVAGDLVGRNLLEFLDPEQVPLVLEQTARRRRGEHARYELAFRRPDGEQRIISVGVSPWFGEHGEYMGSSAIFQDITEQKAAEEAFRQSERKFSDLLDKLGEGFGFIDPQERWALANPAAARLFGLKVEELVGRSLQEFVDEADFRRILEETHRRREGKTSTYEIQVHRPNGESRTVSLTASPYFDGHGTFLGADALFMDITERKRGEEALRQAQKLESLGVLAGGIAHDFNNLLSAILGNVNLAQLKLSAQAPALTYLENAERILVKAAELTKQMLAYSGRGRFVVKHHDLNQVVREMTHLLGVSISKKALLRYELAEGLPPVEADAAQIQQVVMNLVTNASEALGDRDGAIVIRTAQVMLQASALPALFTGQDMKPGPHVILEIADNGSGIDPLILGRIFDPFFSTKQSGRGLGLSAMQGILRGHHAGIQIRSEVGQGSTFTLYFPASEGAVPAPEAAAHPVSRSRFRGRVLLADDEEEVRTATGAMLEALGFTVVAAADGREAVELFQEDPDAVDLAVLDLTMPRMDGREALRELRRLREDLPVILCSGYSEHESQEEGPMGFLQKPFLLGDLRRAIEELREEA